MSDAQIAACDKPPQQSDNDTTKQVQPVSDVNPEDTIKSMKSILAQSALLPGSRPNIVPPPLPHRVDFAKKEKQAKKTELLKQATEKNKTKKLTCPQNKKNEVQKR